MGRKGQHVAGSLQCRYPDNGLLGHRRQAQGPDPSVIPGLRVKMCVWLGVSRGLDLAFLNAD